MREYIERHLGLDDCSGEPHLRQELLGHVTEPRIHGLMRHHGTDPRSIFYEETHQFPELKTPCWIFQKRHLTHACSRLPGKKIHLSPMRQRHYTDAVLKPHRVESSYFSRGLLGWKTFTFKPKPMLAGIPHSTSRQEHVWIHANVASWLRIVLPNLVSAKKLGMKTVWVSTGSRQSPYVDVKISSISPTHRNATVVL